MMYHASEITGAQLHASRSLADLRDATDADLELMESLLIEAREKLSLRDFKSVAQMIESLMPN
jgi:hypothetical protein